MTSVSAVVNCSPLSGVKLDNHKTTKKTSTQTYTKKQPCQTSFSALTKKGLHFRARSTHESTTNQTSPQTSSRFAKGTFSRYGVLQKTDRCDHENACLANSNKETSRITNTDSLCETRELDTTWGTPYLTEDRSSQEA